MSLNDRLDFAINLAREAGAFAHSKFETLDQLNIESKGHQDLVSDADRDTETLIRAAMHAQFPDDGIVGEEYDRKHGTSGFDWVIDPIDGTANFVSGIPHWCVVIACCQNGLPVVGVIFDPCTGEMFQAVKGGGAFVNDRRLAVSQARDLREGSVVAGVSGKSDTEQSVALVREILAPGGMFFRSASGALMLAYVAAGRLLGYLEDHMNAWDCYAALLMIEEAGGAHQALDPIDGLEKGTKLIAGGPHVFPILRTISDTVYT